VRAATLTVVYFIVAKLGLRYATIGPSISPVWPPTGVALAALVLGGLRYWPAILLGAFLANATTGIPVLAAGGIACGNAAEALLAAYLMRSRAGQYPALDDLHAVRTLAGVAAPVGALASASVGVTTLVLAHVVPPDALWSAWGLWWAGDYLGALVFTPVVLAWVASPEPRPVRRQAAELGLMVGGAVFATALVFGGLFPASFLQPADYPYLLFPVVIAAALRFGTRGASLTTLTVAALAVGYTARGGGPFVMQTVPDTAAALLVYVGILAGTGLILSAVAARQRRADRALQDANERLRAAFQSSPLAMYALDAAQIVRSWNPAAEAMYGWGADEVIGRPLPLLARNVEDYAAVRDRVMRGEALKGVEITGEKKDGTPVTVNLSVAPLYDATGKVAGMLSVAADLTEMQRLETQYRHAQKMEAVGRLAGGIAHDFNNVLTAILVTTSSLLEDLGPDAPTRLDVQEIAQAARRAAGLTRQLLAFSRQQLLEPQVLNLNVLVTDLERMLLRLIGEDVKLRTSLAADLWSVRADPGQLEHAIVNLVVNARDAMPQGGRLVIETVNVALDAQYVEAHVPVKPGPYVLIAVSDTGVGMDPATKVHLFEPFFTTKEPGRGTGLGLATVYGIVKQSGGYVWVYSELGQGTTFKIYLPRAEGTPKIAQAHVPAASAVGGSETVLLAEDQETVRLLIQRALEGRGYAVLAAGNGPEALDLAARHGKPIHLLITDLVMPGMNGRELARRLAMERPRLRVLYVSGHVRPDTLEPGVAFLQKPFDPEALAHKVREVLDHASAP